MKFVRWEEDRIAEGREAVDDLVKVKDLGHPSYSVVASAVVVHTPPLMTAAVAAAVDCWYTDDFAVFVPALLRIAG